MKGIVLAGVRGAREWPPSWKLFLAQSLKVSGDRQSCFLAGYARAWKWPEGVKEIAVVMTGLPPERVMEVLVLTETQPRGIDQLLRLGSGYAVPNVSRTARHIIYDGWDGSLMTRGDT